MSTPALILWAVVFAVGIPSAWKNPTAGALVLAKIAGWAWYRVTGDNLPVAFYLFPDIFVVAVIMAKPDAYNFRPYRNWRHQLKCILIERSVPDRIVMLLFVACWVLYAVPIHDYYRWWLLWAITITQFLAAGVESFLKYCRARAAVVAGDVPRSGLEYALAWRLEGYG